MSKIIMKIPLYLVNNNLSVDKISTIIILLIMTK